MKNQKYNEERLTQYANYLKKGNLKCAKIYSELTRIKVGEKVKSDKTLQLVLRTAGKRGCS